MSSEALYGSFASVSSGDERTFTLEDARAFARLSGDYNPIHLDIAAARKTAAGFPVVHGVHAVLWAVDLIAATLEPSQRISAISATFRKYVFADSRVRVHVKHRAVDRIRAEIRTGLGQAVRIDIGLAVRDGSESGCRPEADAADAGAEAPADLSFEDAGRAHGSIGVRPAAALRAFPNLAAAGGARATAALAALSAIVGMRCPGLHSMFGDFTIALSGRIGALRYEAASADARFSFVQLRVSGGGIEGTIGAFRRDPPAVIDTDAARRLVVPGEFSNVRAAIVGASRGIGAATAALIDAGGGRSIATFRTRDASLTEFEARLHGVRWCRFDATEDPAEFVELLPPDLNALYYFATPQIFRRSSPDFEPEQFARFAEVYVHAFARIARAALARCAGTLAVYYPSTTALDEEVPELLEYRMAKAAGEILCSALDKHERLRVVATRLPRIKTDQTSSVVPAFAEDPLHVMLGAVRAMSSASA